MKNKYIIFFVICMVFFGCRTKFASLPDDMEIKLINAKVLEYLKMKKYYLLKVETIVNDTLYIISYNKNENVFTDNKNRKRAMIEKNTNYNFELIEINDRLVNGFPNSKNIIIDNDTLWSNNTLNGIRMFSKRPEIYQSLNSTKLQVFEKK